MLLVDTGLLLVLFFFFFSSRRRHTRFDCDWSSDVCSSDLAQQLYADQTLATFVAQDPIPRDQVTLVEQWFDYKLKQCSNFERAMMNGKIGRASCRERV